MNREKFDEQLEKSRDYGDLFEIVKKVVKRKLGRERAGLMLYLGNLPLHIGAFHGVGSNGIVINKRLLNTISFNSSIEINSYIFTLLLHEYLHSLGYMNERQVRRLVYEICKEAFGEDHLRDPASRTLVKNGSYKIHAEMRDAFKQDYLIQNLPMKNRILNGENAHSPNAFHTHKLGQISTSTSNLMYHI